MKKLPFYVVLLNYLFLGIDPAGALSSAVSPQSHLIEQRVEDTSLLGPQPKVWVIKDNKQAERQPFVWVVKDSKLAQQPLLQLVKDVNKPDVPAASIDPKDSNLQPFHKVVKDTSLLKGLFALYRHKDTGKIYLEIKPDQLNKNYLSTVTMESGIGERGIYSGMPLQDFLFYFRRVNNNLHFVVRNVNFRTRLGDPQARSLNRSFSDSVLYSLPIKSIHPQRQSILVDLGDLLLKDVPGLSLELSSLLQARYQLDDEKSYFGDTKAFPSTLR